MNTFFSVTSYMFDSALSFLSDLFGGVFSVVAGFAFILLIVITINICGSKDRKNFIYKNYKLFTIIFILVLIVAVFSTDTKLLKGVMLAIIVCELIMINKVKIDIEHPIEVKKLEDTHVVTKTKTSRKKPAVKKQVKATKVVRKKKTKSTTSKTKKVKGK